MGKKKIQQVKASDSEGKIKGGKKKKNEVKRQVKFGQAHIKATYNNTIVVFTDTSGNVLVRASAGMLGYKGAKKATPYAATKITESATRLVKPYGLEVVDVYVNGVGMGRDATLRALVANGFKVQSIRDITPLPHNGCRPKKARKL